MKGERHLDGLDDDIRDHLERETQLNIDRGMAPEAARDAARRRFGNVAMTKEDARAIWIPVWVDQLLQDLRYGIRLLRRSAGVSAIVIATLALGIGATTAIYSVVDTILLQPLPFTESDRLVRLGEWIPHVVAGRAPLERGVGYADFMEWRRRATTLTDAAWFGEGQRTMRTADGTLRLWEGTTSLNAFTLLGTHALLGRTYGPEDAANPSVAVLTADSWRRHFHADPGVVGASIDTYATIQAYAPGVAPRGLTIVGVLPPGFDSPARLMDFYTPFVSDAVSNRFTGTVIARLQTGVSLSAALDEANVIGTAIRPPLPAGRTPLTVRRFDVQLLKDRVVKDLRPALRVLLAAVVAVLMIVCANVANLLLARGTARQREMAVRSAIGASRGRVVRQVLTECVILAIVGGALGAVCGAAGVTLVKRLAAVEAPGIFRIVFGASLLPRGNEVGIGFRMFGTAFGVAALTSLVFGALPALQLSRTNQLQAMGPRGGGTGRVESRIRAGLVVGQLGLATVLLIGAGLLIHSFVKLSTVENGYDPSHVVAFQLVFPPGYPLPRKVATIETIRARLDDAPNVAAAGSTRAGVLIPEEIFVGTLVPTGRTVDEMRTDPLRPHVRPVSAGFLTAMGVPVLEGREIDASDATAATASIVLSRMVARRYFGTDRAVGHTIDWYSGTGAVTPAQVVGVVEDLRNESPDREAQPEIFVEYRQLLAIQGRWGDPEPRREQAAIGFLSFAVRAKGRPESAMPTITQIVRSVDPTVGIDAMIPMDRLVASSVARQRFYAVLLGVFAGVAGVLAAIGIYGMLAYAVVQRTQEIGIRMALGAQRTQVLALVLRKGAILTTIGITLGLAAAAAGSRLLQGMLFGITPLDVRTFVAVSVMFGLVAAFASYIPARRATCVDPMLALRSE